MRLSEHDPVGDVYIDRYLKGFKIDPMLLIEGESYYARFIIGDNPSPKSPYARDTTMHVRAVREITKRLFRQPHFRVNFSPVAANGSVSEKVFSKRLQPDGTIVRRSLLLTKYVELGYFVGNDPSDGIQLIQNPPDIKSPDSGQLTKA